MVPTLPWNWWKALRFVLPRLAVTGIASYAKHHCGLDYDSTKTLDEQWTREELLNHDELMRSDQVDYGGGVAFLVNRSTSVYANFLTMAWGINGHALNQGIFVGINFRFRTRRPKFSANLVDAEDQPDCSLVPLPKLGDVKACH